MRDLLAFIDLLRADLAKASEAIEAGDMPTALERFASVSVRIDAKVRALRGQS